jgi:hypothetical protein
MPDCHLVLGEAGQAMWESFGPTLAVDGRLTESNRNNSDVDFCEFRGRTIIYYSWGDQQGTEFLAEAVYDGSLASFLKGFFP